MATGRTLARTVGVLLLCAVAGVGAYLFVRSRIASAAPPPAGTTISPVQSVQQTVQVVVPGPSGSTLPAATSGKPASAAPTTPPPAAVTIGDFTFEVRSCRRVASGVQCDFQVTNAGEETHLRVYTYTDQPDTTVAFDQSGVTRTVIDARFAGVRYSGLLVEARLSPTVPTPLVLVFEATPAAAFNAITLGIRIPSGSYNWAPRAVVFRNVKIDG